MKFAQQIRRMFRKLTPAEVAATELAEAELSRLSAQAAREYAAAMEGYQDARIKRLKAYLKTTGEQQ